MTRSGAIDSAMQSIREVSIASAPVGRQRGSSPGALPGFVSRPETGFGRSMVMSSKQTCGPE
jgi:hypothetical protein